MVLSPMLIIGLSLGHRSVIDWLAEVVRQLFQSEADAFPQPCQSSPLLQLLPAPTLPGKMEEVEAGVVGLKQACIPLAVWGGGGGLGSGPEWWIS